MVKNKLLYLLSGIAFFLVQGVTFTVKAEIPSDFSTPFPPPFSRFLEEMKSPKKSSRHWATYSRTFGNEMISVKFPKTPVFKESEGIVFTHYSKKKMLYSMVTLDPPRAGLKQDELFPLAIATLCQHPNCLIAHSISRQNGWDILDTISQDYETKMTNKARLIITPENFYLLQSSFVQGAKEQHDYFIHSFLIK